VPVLHSSAIDIASITPPKSPGRGGARGGVLRGLADLAGPGGRGERGDVLRDHRRPPGGHARAREGARGRRPGARHHTVARGDTLFSLSQKYYGTRSRWRDIYARQPRRPLPSEKTPLKIGTDLKIP
jgi:hypothetical protein